MSYLGLETVRHGNTGACLQDIRFWQWPDADAVYQHRIIGLDIEPIAGAIQSDYRHVPLKDQSVDVAVFDPPFIFTRGVQRISGTKRGFLGTEGVEEIGFPKDSSELRTHTTIAMLEMRRIARHGMVLKGQDLVTGKDVNWWAYHTMQTGAAMWNMLPYDMLIQVSPAARLKDPRWKNQYHFRRRHVIYLVYKW